LFCITLLSTETEARFLGQFSLTLGEEFNDNIFFSSEREHDFITQIVPTLSLTYQPDALTIPIFKLNLSPVGQVFARHAGENNFGDNLLLDGQFQYPFSPRLSFAFADAMQIQGAARSQAVGTYPSTPILPTQLPAPGLSREQKLGNFLESGDNLSNHFSVQTDYLVSPSITLNAAYTNGYTAFMDAGGNEISHEIGIRGVYQWRQEHNLHSGYTVKLLRPRKGGVKVLHNFDVGDDFFSNTQIQLSPTLTLSGSSGISFNTSDDGPRIANNTSVTLIKLWQTASFMAGLRKGLTNSFGVAGISDTLTVFSSFNVRLSEKLSAVASIDHSRFDTDVDEFNALQASVSLQYALTSWACPSLSYSHRRRFGGESIANNGDRRFQTSGNVSGNSLLLAITGSFDIWPNLRLGSGQGCGIGSPAFSPQPSVRGRL
jgi:hypothetical protein